METINSSLCPPTKSSGTHINKCQKCDKILASKYSLKEHYERVHTQRDPIKCPYCSKLSKNPSSLKSHITLNHTDHDSKLLVPCPKCQKVVQKGGLKDHLKIHQERKGWVCETCGRTLKSKDSYVYHRQQFHSAVPNAFPCQICGKVSSSKYCLMVHTKTHISRKKIPCHLCSKPIHTLSYNTHVRACSGQNKATCYFCHKESIVSGSLAGHIRSSHTKEKPFSCKKCSFKTSHLGSLKYHENYKHMQNTCYTCYFCGFKSAYRPALTDHLIAKHIKEVPFKCEFCPKRYSVHGTLKTHMRRGGPTKEDKMKHGLFHTKVECPKCLKVIEKVTLTEHLKLHDEPKYKCTLCTKVCSSRKSYWSHTKYHDVCKKNVKFECEICGRFFSCKMSLVTHMRTHKTGRTKITCPLCGARLLPECYNGHISIVHGPPRFHCYFCGNRFRSPHALRGHLLSQHVKEIPLKCNNCLNFRTCHPSVLRQHVKAHHVKRTEYACYFCNRHYLNKSHFIDHVNNHLLNRGWKCKNEECEKRFFLRGQLRRHNSQVYKCKL